MSVRLTVEKPITYAITYIEGACASTDSKPIAGIATGSNLLEADTGDFYVYDEASTAWVKQLSLQS